MKGITAILGICAFIIMLVLSARPAQASGSCGTSLCGDGVVDPGEQCDDGNLQDGDGCSSACIESFDMVSSSTLFTYPGEHPTYVIVADWNQDGIQDWALTTARPSYLYTYLRDAAGQSHVAGRYYLGGNGLWMDVGELNGDHYPDIAISERDAGHGLIFFNNGDGSMTFAAEYDAPYCRSISVGNLDSDGFDDVIISQSDISRFLVLYGDGHGNFPRSQTISSSSALTSHISDMNGDGYKDVLFTHEFPQGELKLYLGSAAGIIYHHSIPGAPSANVADIDINDDGYPDLFTKGLPLSTYINQKDPGITMIQNQTWFDGVEGYYWITTDLDNDGRLDVPIGLRTNYFPVYLNHGTGVLGPTVNIPIPGQANQFGAIDYNNDGTTDLIVGSYTISRSFLVENHNYYQFPRCGDWRIGRGENCDDGNTISGDGCSSVCRLEQTGDSDNDGLADYQEAELGTDPQDPDTDGDCSKDADELCAGTNPLVPDGAGCNALVVPNGNWHLLATILDAPQDQDIDLYLEAPRAEPLVKHSLKNVGKFAQTPLKDGDPLVIGVVVNGEYEYLSNSSFAQVTRVDAFTYLVKFETLPLELCDWDYSEMTVRLEFVAQAPAVGVHKNLLDEFQATVIAAGSNLALANNFDGAALLQLPAAVLADGTGVILTAGLPNLYDSVAPDSGTGQFLKVNLTGGQTHIEEPGILTVKYEDADADGIADGTPFLVADLVIYHYNEADMAWEALPSTVDISTQTVSAAVANFSLFSLGQALAPVDSDGDGVPDPAESLLCMDPHAVDSDGDGLADGSEDQDHDGQVDPGESSACLADTDADGIDDAADNGCLSAVSADSDGDGLLDGWEQAQALNGCDSADADSDEDGDGNGLVHEFYNGTPAGAWNVTGGVGCAFWGEADGDLVNGPGDLSVLRAYILGVGPHETLYHAVIPPNTRTQDLDNDVVAGPGDLTMLQAFIKGLPVGTLANRPADLAIYGAAPAQLAVGDTVRLSVLLTNEGGGPSYGFGVTFAVVSGSATLFGGEGKDGAGRYDITDVSPAGVASMVVRANAPGAIVVQAVMPGCGNPGFGRYAPALTQTFTIQAQ